MDIKIVVTGFLQENCYILKDDNREKALSYFNESNGYVKQVLDFYYKQKEKG